MQNLQTHKNAPATANAIRDYCYWNKTVNEVFGFYKSSVLGLSQSEAAFRLRKYGTNELTKKQKKVFILGFLTKFFNPLIVVLLLTSFISLMLGQKTNFFIILTILIISALIDFYQEYQAEEATDRLRQKVSILAKVVRDGIEAKIPVSQLVPGDIIELSVGNLVPADARIIENNNLLVDESTLTGESYPSEKTTKSLGLTSFQLSKIKNCLFMGSGIVFGEAKAIVIATGESTQFGKIALSLVEKRPQTDFEKGIQNFSVMVTQITAVLIAFIFLTTLLLHHGFLSSLMFALAIAIGLVPEALPMVMSINLSRGAIRLAKKNVIVKNLSSIQDFGSMGILCTDKTGTLTEGKIELLAYEGFAGQKNTKLELFSHIAAAYQSVRGNPMIEAIVRFFGNLKADHFKKIKEIPFDFFRRMSSVVAESDDSRILITHGAIERVLPLCLFYEADGKREKITDKARKAVNNRFEELSRKGIRVLAVGYKK